MGRLGEVSRNLRFGVLANKAYELLLSLSPDVISSHSEVQR
jgi:hypothetical protein